MRYFVSGGAGFIGSNYIGHLLHKVEGVTGVTIFDKFTYAANSKNYREFASDPRLTVIRGDICDVSWLEKSMAEHDFTINFAAESHVDRSIEDASAFVNSNILGTFNVLESSRKLDIRTVIQVSTDEVYGNLLKGSAGETHPLQPNSPYSASKAASDLMARSYFMTHGLDVRITRCCNNYGKNQFPEKLIPFFINKLISGEKMPIYGDGMNIREWIHVSDHVRGIQMVLEKGEPGEIYNIGTGSNLSNNDVANAILAIMGLRGDMKAYVPDRPGHDFRYSVDSSKIKTLGFECEVDFNDGLSETIDWYIANQDWWKTANELKQ